MCTIMEGYMEKSRAAGRAEERIENIAKLLSRGGTEDQAKLFLDATDEEIELARKNMVESQIHVLSEEEPLGINNR